MPQEARRTVSPETIERGVARGKQLQARAVRGAFMSLFRKAEPTRPAAGRSAGQDGFARA